MEYMVVYLKDGDRQAEVDIVDSLEKVGSIITSYEESVEYDEEYDPEYLRVYELGRDITEEL